MKLMALVLLGSVHLASSCGLSAQFLKPAGQWLVEPDELGFEFEAFELETGPHTSVYGWFLPNSASDGRTVILCHGSAANISYYHPYYSFLHAAGYHVLLFDYRGYGKSRGDLSIDALFTDTERVLEYASERPDVDPGKLVLFGTSLGSIVALRSAARHPELAGLIVEDAVSPKAAIDQALGGVLSAIVRTVLLPGRVEPANNAKLVQCPSLFLCGVWDPALLQHLEVAANVNGPVASWVQPETAHAPNGLLEHDGEYQDAVSRFLEACIEDRCPRIDLDVEDLPATHVELAARELQGALPAPVELCRVSADGAAQFSRHWVGEAGLRVELDGDHAYLAAWPYQRVRVDPRTELWVRRRGALALSGDALLHLRGIANLARESSSPLPDARVFVEELQRFEAANGELADLAQAELVPDFLYVGEALFSSPESSDRELGERLLARCVQAEPELPGAHYWPAVRYRVGFPHAAEVERARELLSAMQQDS